MVLFQKVTVSWSIMFPKLLITFYTLWETAAAWEENVYPHPSISSIYLIHLSMNSPLRLYEGRGRGGVSRAAKMFIPTSTSSSSLCWITLATLQMYLHPVLARPPGPLDPEHQGRPFQPGQPHKVNVEEQQLDSDSCITDLQIESWRMKPVDLNKKHNCNLSYLPPS